MSPFCPSGAVSGEIGCGGGRVAARVIPGCSQFHCFDIVSYLFPFHPAFAHVCNLSICLSICLHVCLSACPSVGLLTTVLWSDVVLPENRARKCCDVRVSPFLLAALVHTRTHANTQTDIPTRTQSNIQSIYVRIHHACKHTHTHKHIRTSESHFLPNPSSSLTPPSLCPLPLPLSMQRGRLEGLHKIHVAREVECTHTHAHTLTYTHTHTHMHTFIEEK